MDTIKQAVQPAGTATVEREIEAEVFLTGEAILQQGDDSQFVCELISGTAKVIREGDVVSTIGEGEYFGTIAALTGRRRMASIVAAEHCMVRKISKHKFRLLLQTQPEIVNELR